MPADVLQKHCTEGGQINSDLLDFTLNGPHNITLPVSLGLGSAPKLPVIYPDGLVLQRSSTKSLWSVGSCTFNESCGCAYNF